MNALAKLLLHATALIILAALLLPLVFSVWVSFSPDSFLTPPGSVWSLRWHREFWADPRWNRALWQSLLVASLATGLALATGIPLAFALGRGAFTGSVWIEYAILLPALVPPVALGLGVLFMVQGTLWQNQALIPAHALLGLPMVALIVRSGLTGIDPALESAARGLGASPFQAMRQITMPLLAPSILVASATVFVISLNESMLAIFLTHPGNETLPAVAWPQLRHAPTPMVAVASCVSVAVTVGIVLMIGTIRSWKGSGEKRTDMLASTTEGAGS
jgi:putative spermidine/putrescine transport system permease protein